MVLNIIEPVSSQFDEWKYLITKKETCNVFFYSNI